MILIGTDEGIYRWFEGAGWPVYHGLQDRAVVGLKSPSPGAFVALDQAGGLLESSNGGLSWTPVPLPAGAGRATAVALSPTSRSVVVAVKPLAMYRRVIGGPVSRTVGPAWVGKARSLADGATALLTSRRVSTGPDAEAARLAGWSPLNAPPAPRTATGPEVRAMIEVGGALLAGVGTAGLYRSVDQGRTWTQIEGLPAEVYMFRAVPGRPGEVWAGTAEGCKLSTDGGQTWADRSSGLEAAKQVRAIAVKPDDPKVLLAGAAPAPSGEVGSPRGGLGFALYESTDGGQKWSAVVKKNFPEALEYDTINDVAFDPAAPDDILVALGSGELWATTNGGAYWGPLARQIRAARVLCPTG